jgi:succinate dehydrogenase/fumarate reductase flavoprotein subunit
MPFMGGNSVKATSGARRARARHPGSARPEPARWLPTRASSRVAGDGSDCDAARAGINGALTKTQMKAGIKDSAEIFEEDTLRGARGLAGLEPPEYTPPLAHVLTHESGPAVDWLTGTFGLDLSLVSRLGGHSQPRTHRGGAKFPGFTITYALMEKLEEIDEKSGGEIAKIINKATARATPPPRCALAVPSHRRRRRRR